MRRLSGGIIGLGPIILPGSMSEGSRGPELDPACGARFSVEDSAFAAARLHARVVAPIDFVRARDDGWGGLIGRVSDCV